MQTTFASNSSIRQQLLRSANLDFEVIVSNLDELACKRDLEECGCSPKDIAIKLAGGKAKHVARETDGLIIGCDQVLEFEGRLFSKPKNRKDLRKQSK